MELIVLSALGTTTLVLTELYGLVRARLTRGRRATSRAQWTRLPTLGPRGDTRDNGAVAE